MQMNTSVYVNYCTLHYINDIVFKHPALNVTASQTRGIKENGL